MPTGIFANIPKLIIIRGFMKYWLLKTEPSTFGIRDLEECPQQTTSWEGVRNFQARNMLRDELHKGDLAFFYHSSCKVPGIVAVVKVVRGGYPDMTAFDVNSPYYDAKSTPENPRWYRVDVKLVKKFARVITLTELHHIPALKNMRLLRKGNRLSVLPITSEEWQVICSLE